MNQEFASKAGPILITCLAVTTVIGQTESAASKLQPSEKVYKNIQILKGIPTDEMII
jgi:hypothetical protein